MRTKAKQGIIYLVINKTNKKCYVGKTTVGLKQRWKSHCNGAIGNSKLALHRAIRKYGSNSFELSVLAHAPLKELDSMEYIWINLLNSTTPNGYNMTLGGDGGIPTDAVRKDRNKKIKLSWADPSVRAKRLVAHQAALSKTEYREKQRQITQKRWDDPKRRAKWLKSITSVKTRKKISIAAKKMWKDSRTRTKLMKSLRTAKNRARLASNAKALRNNPKFLAAVSTKEYKKKLSCAAKKKWNNPEFRKKVVENMQRASLKLKQSLKKFWTNNPKARKAVSVRIKEIVNRPEVKKKLRNAALKQKHDLHGRFIK